MPDQLVGDFTVRRPLLLHVANSLRDQITEVIADAKLHAAVVFNVATPEEFAELARRSGTEYSHPLVEITDQISGRIEAATLEAAQSIETLVGEHVSVVASKWASNAQGQPPFLSLRCLIPPQAKPDGWSARHDVPAAFQLLVVVKPSPPLTVYPTEPRLELPTGNGAPNRALIMEGGGIKGLAYVGALEVLAGRYDFDWYVGTSAGAITAIFLAAGYSTDEMTEILRTKNFKDFFDAKWYAKPFNLVAHRGFHHAKTFTDWVDELLAKKLDSLVRVRLSHITAKTGNRVTLYASRKGKPTLTFDSVTADADAAFAVRCSMSIPFVFTPQYDQGIRTYDGGVRQNYPVQQLLDDHPGTPFVGFFLGPERYEPDTNSLVSLDLYSLFLEPNDAALVEKYRDRTVIIDTRPIGVLDFDLSNDEKDFLLACGRVGAQRHLDKDGNECAEATRVRDTLRITVKAARSKAASKKRKRRIAIAILILVLAGLYFGWGYVASFVNWTRSTVSQKLGHELPGRPFQE